MINFSKYDKVNFDENGYIIKDLFYKNEQFNKISIEFKKEILSTINKINFQNIGGFSSGNLNINPGRYGKDILELLLKKKFKDFFNFITGDNIENFKI
mgnify:FL=1